MSWLSRPAHFAGFLLFALHIAFVAKASDDSPEERLVLAKKAHSDSVSKLSEKFGQAIGGKIKLAATSGDLQRVKELIAIKEDFEAGGAVPADPDIAEDALRYISDRKASASALFRAYQTAVRELTVELKINEATAVDEEMKKFILVEKQAMQIGVSAAPLRQTTQSPEKPRGTKENFEEWYERYTQMMEDVMAELTTAKQENAHREMVKKIDDRLKQQTWTFHCTIRDVRENDGQVTLEFDYPVEAPQMEERWQCLNSASNLKFSKQQALNLVPGDVLVITGTPRFVANLYGSRDAFFSRSLSVADQYTSHSILITNFKHSIQKKKADGESDELGK